MATSSTGNQIYLCHFCSDEFSNRAILIAHFSQCQIKKSIKKLNKNLLQPPQLTQTQLDILYMVKLHPSNNQFSSNHIITNNLNLEIPLSTLYSRGYLSSSNQLSFDDSYCNLNNTEIYIPTNDNEEYINSNQLLSYHIYKYSRSERKLYYSRIKNSLRKKHLISSKKKFYSNENLFNQINFLINIPTKINSRQKILHTNSNHIYPLLFSPNFHTLVKLPINTKLNNYLFNINISFHLIHSIASQEFQILINNYDNQQKFSFINILRQTIYDYTKNFQTTTTLKRNYSQIYHLDNDNELSIPPLKIRRYDDSSYEIEKRSISSSSDISITHINNGQQYEDRRRFETRSKKFPSKISDNQINSNFNDIDKNDIHDLTVGSSLTNDLSIIIDQQDRINTKSSLNYINEQKSKTSLSPILIKEQSNDSLPKYQSVVLNEGARIRIVNCSNDNNKHLSTRNNSIQIPIKNSIDKLDENWTTKTTRINTRKISSTNCKTADILEILPTYQTQSVILSNNDISNKWLTHNVFYRCHVCSHEEFFVVLSRECMRLHISSKHGNMEENFKQRISNFLNNQGRALKIFQHYLKWQQPWSEKEIDQIFQLSNINNRMNGAL